MKCMNCGYDNEEDANLCIYCGSALRFHQNPLKEIMRQLLEDKLFIALCILYSASIVLLLFSRNFPIIKILMAIFLWIIYAKREKGVIDSRYMRCISGTVFAFYVTRWIWNCILVLGGFFLAAVAVLMDDASGEWRMLYYIIGPFFSNYSKYLGNLASFFLILVAIILIIVAVISMVMNVTGMRSIHRFAQSLYKSLEDGKVNIVKCGTAKTWLMVFGVLNAISALFGSSGGFSFLAEGCLSAVYIIGSILVKKYFSGFQSD